MKIIGVLAVAVVLAFPRMAAAQAGQPDIQGFWRPVVDGASHSVEEGPEPANASITGQRDRKRQTIIVGGGTDPQLPYQPWAAAKRLDHLANFHTPTQWAHLDPEDRCLLNGVPRSNYRGTMQILQSPGYVTILYEWNHAYRVIPLDGRPHAPAAVKQWNGDSRGRWEGNTLVVDVSNFLVDDAEHNVQPWFDSHGSFYSDALHVVERYTVVNADTIRYEATVEDPKVFTRPWQVGFTVSRNKQPGYELLEEACVEGERNTPGMIAAGRIAKAAGQTGIHTHGEK
jgi:hypothetical protein